MGYLSQSLRRRGAPVTAALFFLALSASPSSGAAPLGIDLYIAEAPPLSMLDKTGLHGIVGDATLEAATQAGYELNCIEVPWARAQQSVRRGVDKLIIPLSRTPEREADYTWIAPIMTMDRAFFSLHKRVETLQQARETFARIAVGRGSAQEQKLRAEGFSDNQIYPFEIGENPAQLLLMGRVDAWFNGIPETQSIWRKLSNQPLQVSPALMSTDLYLACSKNCDAVLVRKLSAAVEALRKDGTLERIRKSYLDAP
ncbi:MULTISPECIES: ABC transporter substrate-binding protein [Pseudomonas]|uniref:Amino acid ABC transporter substrate-binding protein n=1 Tax=Pseudomonas protegens TaxID=380021 RepID=A0A9Q6IJU6_9PSED|nr:MULTISPECIES: transporter substrate-binding domain-containing protein [Pseudomonas]MBS7562486.1 transporter substrate-binding domain-containing protein [Pseudomonas sp. RC4D1]PYC41506.1 amino acid ABC transporter substrate-binding protein [Pseudomonas protegens]ROL96818.1 amino acid ABC transporter substrate-binding protein [Pseudomonas protegens]ROM03097.1 amino acid ABC transporter substrate-binding protein [Pseudomonas protegens]ROM08606.1 amino acid ABC transporter substrate-binding pro